MRKTKLWLIIGIVCSVLSLLFYAGCVLGYFYLENHIEEYNNEWQTIEYVAFSTEEFTEATPDFIPATEIMNYESKWSGYNSRICYESVLSEQEQFIYRVYEYAMDNSTPYIYIEKSLLTGNRSFVSILELLSMDCALVEQNASVVYENCKFTVSEPYLYKTLTKEIHGTCMYISDFSYEKTAKIDEVISVAKEIVSELSIDENSSDVETAEAIYRYLGKNVTYKKYGDTTDNYYLYDALCGGSSNCDGYSNAFALLCSMYDIPCVEKISAYERYDTEGHTWNSVLLDGVWYNVDATYSHDLFEGELKGIHYRFGFSDELQFYKYKYSTLLPECTEDLYPPDCRFETCNDNNLVSSIVSAFRNTDERYVMITFETFDNDALANHMQDIANQLYANIYYTYYKEPNCNIVFIIKR